MSGENVDIVRRSIEAHNRQDLEGMRATAHSDFVLDWSRSRGLEAAVYEGLDAAMHLQRSFFDIFEKDVVVPERFIASGDFVVVPNTAHLEGRDGIETTATSVFVYELRDGLITRLTLYQELDEALEAAGAT